NIDHVYGPVNAVRDKEAIDMELQLKDLETVDKKLEKVKRASRTGNKDAQREEVALLKAKKGLKEGRTGRAIDIAPEEREELSRKLQLITDKLVMYVCNVDEKAATTGNKFVDQVKEAVKDENAEVLVLAVGTEADITELEDYEERQMFLQD